MFKTEQVCNKLLLLSLKLNQDTLFFLDYIPILTKKNSTQRVLFMLFSQIQLIDFLDFDQFNFKDKC